MEKLWQEFSAKLDEFLGPMDNVLVVVFAAVMALLLKVYGILP